MSEQNQIQDNVFSILAINPGSTSTKIAFFQNDERISEQTINHEKSELAQFDTVMEQESIRTRMIEEYIHENDIDLKKLSAVVARGGFLHPMEGGTYQVNEQMIHDLKENRTIQHASSLGALIALKIAQPLGIDSFIVDPIVVDEMIECAKMTGLPEIRRKSVFHALNQKAVARRYAHEHNKAYEECRLIVVHMGGGVSVGAHQAGKVIDVNDALGGDGPLSPERSGGLPVNGVVSWLQSSNEDMSDFQKRIVKQGGLAAYFGDTDMRKCVESAQKGDSKSQLVLETFVYQIAKEIGAMSTVLMGKVDAILLTGGIAYSEVIVNDIKKRAGFLADVVVYPGEDEMLALAQGALRVLSNQEKAKIYT